MEVVRTLDVDASPAALFGHVDDLTAYAAWMPLIHSVRSDDDGSSPAWIVELRANVGPLARSKRLRMVRTQHEVDRCAVFERCERDGRQHSPWILRADLEPLPLRVDVTSSSTLTTTSPPAVDAPSGPTRVRMTLSYGGSLWAGPILQRVLDDQVRRGSENLVRLVTST